MKHVIYIAFAFFMALGACKNEEIDAYQGNNGIYFEIKGVVYDTVFVSWGLKSSEIKEMNLTLNVCLFGNVVPYDRKFLVDVISDVDDEYRAEEGVDYKSFSNECVMPANQAKAKIDITLLRRDDLMDQDRRFTVRLRESDELKFLYYREVPLDSAEWIGNQRTRALDIQRVIYMNERFRMPIWWDIYGGSNILGKYSAKKMILICDVMNLKREDFITQSAQDNKVTIGYLKFVGKYMHRWLQENPTEDEDGELMEMGPASRN